MPDRVGRHARVTFPDGTALEATCIAVDVRLDQALLKPDAPADLPFATLASAAPVLGEPVAIIGQPGGYAPFYVSFGEYITDTRDASEARFYVNAYEIDVDRSTSYLLRGELEAWFGADAYATTDTYDRRSAAPSP